MGKDEEEDEKNYFCTSSRILFVMLVEVEMGLEVKVEVEVIVQQGKSRPTTNRQAPLPPNDSGTTSGRCDLL